MIRILDSVSVWIRCFFLLQVFLSFSFTSSCLAVPDKKDNQKFKKTFTFLYEAVEKENIKKFEGLMKEIKDKEGLWIVLNSVDDEDDTLLSAVLTSGNSSMLECILKSANELHPNNLKLFFNKQVAIELVLIVNSLLRTFNEEGVVNSLVIEEIKELKLLLRAIKSGFRLNGPVMLSENKSVVKIFKRSLMNDFSEVPKIMLEFLSDLEPKNMESFILSENFASIFIETIEYDDPKIMSLLIEFLINSGLSQEKIMRLIFKEEVFLTLLKSIDYSEPFETTRLVLDFICEKGLNKSTKNQLVMTKNFVSILCESAKKDCFEFLEFLLKILLESDVSDYKRAQFSRNREFADILFRASVNNEQRIVKLMLSFIGRNSSWKVLSQEEGANSSRVLVSFHSVEEDFAKREEFIEALDKTTERGYFDITKQLLNLINKSNFTKQDKKRFVTHNYFLQIFKRAFKAEQLEIMKIFLDLTMSADLTQEEKSKFFDKREFVYILRKSIEKNDLKTAISLLNFVDFGFFTKSYWCLFLIKLKVIQKILAMVLSLKLVKRYLERKFQEKIFVENNRPKIFESNESLRPVAFVNPICFYKESTLVMATSMRNAFLEGQTNFYSGKRFEGVKGLFQKFSSPSEFQK